MILRPMGQQDIQAAAALEAQCFSQPWTEKDFADAIHLSYTYYVAAFTDDGKLIGNAGLRNIAGEGELTNIAVDVMFRRRGVAAELIEYLLRQGESLGIREYTLEVRSSNLAAVSLYERFGFRQEGIRRDFYQSPREDALVMWKR